jgi:DNA-binding NarL/FixJ family response regulator
MCTSEALRMNNDPLANEAPRPASAPETVRLVIADDHELAREGLRSVLARERGLEVIGEATNGREAVSLCHRLRPDLVLMDVRMPEMDGLAATRAIKAELPRTSVIIVTMHEDPDYLLEALQAGAAGYVLKDSSKREIVTAVRQVLRGESLLPSALAAQLLRRLTRDTQSPGPTLPEPLTSREREVLQLLVEGRTNREIAAHLVISVGTVKSHVEHIIRKLEVSDRTQAAVRAITLGLVTATSE